MTLSLMVTVSQPFSAWERIVADKAMTVTAPWHRWA